MLAEYGFLDRWFVPHPLERVFDVIGDTLSYPDWWSDVFLEASGDPGPPEPGRRTSVVARGFLPYRLRFTLEVVEVERPTRIASRLSGDFEGSGEWRLRESEGGTACELEWRPIVNKPFVRQLTPVLRPLFRSNHEWTMRRGQRHIVRLLADAPEGAARLGAWVAIAAPADVRLTVAVDGTDHVAWRLQLVGSRGCELLRGGRRRCGARRCSFIRWARAPGRRFGGA
jgi:hypothetical protein